MEIHLILPNYGTHNHPNVKAWLAKHPRYHLNFTPTSSSWLNLVERWFGEITRKRLRRGVFRSVPELEAAIAEYIRLNNDEPKPFVWTKKVDPILEKVAHCKAVIETLHYKANPLLYPAELRGREDGPKIIADKGGVSRDPRLGGAEIYFADFAG